MRKKIFAVLLFLFQFMLTFSQDKLQDIVVLKNGEKYKGEIVLKNDEILLLKTDDGKRFQFQMSDVEKTDRQMVKVDNKETIDDNSFDRGNFSGLFQLGGGFFSSPNTRLENGQNVTVSLAFGSRKAFSTNAFMGAGVGYEALFTSRVDSTVSFLLVFLQTKIPLNNKKISPVIGSKIGYDFTLNDLYKGGILFDVSGGIHFKLSDTSSALVELVGNVHQVNGKVTEKNELGQFSKIGKAAIYSLGLNFSLMF